MLTASWQRQPLVYTCLSFRSWRRMCFDLIEWCVSPQDQDTDQRDAGGDAKVEDAGSQEV